MESKLFKADWLTEEFFNNLGYVKVSDDGQCAKYQSTNKAIKHVISGYNQPLWNGQRTIAFNRQYFVKEGVTQYMHLGIKCDGDTRTLFNGVIQTKEDLLSIIKLVD